MIYFVIQCTLSGIIIADIRGRKAQLLFWSTDRFVAFAVAVGNSLALARYR